MVDPVTDEKYAIFEPDDRTFLARMFVKYPKVEANFERYLSLPKEERFSQGQKDMKTTPRSGLVEWGVLNPKTLFEHTNEVREYAAKNAPPGLEKPKIHLMATLHDLPEVVMTDFTPRDKISSVDKAHLERLALEVLTDKQYIKDIVEEFDKKETPLALWVNDADKLCMLREVLQCEALQPELMEKSYYPPGVSPKVGMFNEFIAYHAPRIKTEKGKELLADLAANADVYRVSHFRGVV